MKNLSDNWEELRLKVLGLGDSSVRKTHYPSLRKRLAELEQIRSKLQQNEAYLAEAQKLSHTGSFGWYVSSGEIFWSDEAYRIFEYDRSVKPTMDSVVQRVHPQDRADFQKVIDGAPRGATDFEHSYRLLLPDGRTKHIHALAHALVDASGNREFVGAAIDVTSIKRAEEELRRSEFYLAEGQRLGHMGSWAFDPAGFDYWSPELFRMYGLDPATKPPTVQEYLDFIHAQDRESMANLIEGILAKATPFDATKRIVRPDGEVRYIRCVGVPLVGNQDLKKFVGSAIDVTEHELLTQELRRREAYLTEAQRLSHTGSFGWRPDNGEIVWSDETYRIFEYHDSVKPTIDSVVQRVHPQDRTDFQKVIDGASRGATDFEHAYRLLLPDGRVKHVHAIAHALQDASDNREFVGAVSDITERKTSEDKIRRLVDAGILGIFIGNLEGEIVEANQAFLQMFQYDRQDLLSGRLRWEDMTPAELRERDQRAVTEAQAAGFFQPYEKQYFRKDGSRVPVLIGGALFQDSNEGVSFVLDLSEQKRAEAKIREQEAELREVIDSIPAMTWSAGPDGSNSYVNSRFIEYCGMRAEEMAGSGWRAATHPDDVERHNANWLAHVASGKPFEDEVRFRRADGQYRWHLQRAIPRRDESGNIVKWYGVLTDIEDRKRAEEVVRRSEEELRQLIDAIPQQVFVFDPEWNPLFANRRELEYTGLTAQEARSKKAVAKIFHPDDLNRLEASRERGRSVVAPFEAEARIRGIDGRYRWFLVRDNPLLDEQGHVLRWYGTRTDIEDRKRAEEALRRSESYLAEAQRLSQTGSWAWSPDEDIKYWSEECYRVLSFDPQDGLPRFEDFFERIHPDDQPGLRELIQTAIREKAEWQADYRIVHPDGPVRDIHVVGHPVLSTSGHLLEFVGTVIDVTERKRAEEELRKSEVELRQILDLAPQLIAVYGPNRERLYANRVSLDYLGLSLEEWQQSPGGGKYFHSEDTRRIDDLFDRAVARASEVEVRLRKADGSYRWFLARFNPLHDEKGQLTRWYVAATDIEYRKQIEDILRRENVALREEIDKSSMFEEIVGTSRPLQTVLSRISKVARSDSSVLITGETGTGKELVARAIHRRSNRASRAFVSVNCAAIPRDLIASELFGHEKGSFTGATQQRLGRFELANGGTIFLDEAGDLPAETQIALLRVLQEHEFERVGGTRPIRADVRVIAATNRDLQAAISAGSFRSDLFYRLNVFPIEIPPLRERKEDIPLLVEYFIDRYARKAGKHFRSVEKRTLQALQSYAWPGNIRELQNVIERSVIVCETENFSVDESWLSQKPPERKAESQLYPSEAQEKEIIEAALRQSQGRVFGPSGAAAKLGIARSTLESKIRSLKINKNHFKA